MNEYKNTIVIGEGIEANADNQLACRIGPNKCIRTQINDQEHQMLSRVLRRAFKESDLTNSKLEME